MGALDSKGTFSQRAEFLKQKPRMARLLFVTAVALGLVSSIVARPDGAPVQACRDLTPDHIVPPQTSEPNFQLEVEQNTENNGYRVKLNKTTDEQFKGFIIQARTESGDITGRFEILDPDNTGLLMCRNANGEEAESTVTHKNNLLKDSVEFDYYLPEGSDGAGVTFKASVVQNFFEYWVGIERALLEWSQV